MGLTRRELLGTVAVFGLHPRLDTRGQSPGSLGTLIDFSDGIPSADAICTAGYLGVIRYVSDRRPGAEKMIAKPLLAAEVAALKVAGLQIVSCYQYGKGPTADWLGGEEAGKKHAQRGLELHRAAGGPDGRPIYASIDDNPKTEQQYDLVCGYLTGWLSVLGKENTGVYANSPTIDRVHAAGVASWFWQHDWGTPDGYVHPCAHLHQLSKGHGGRSHCDGIEVDLDTILAAEYGQW